MSSRAQVIHEIGDFYHNDHRVLNENERKNYEEELKQNRKVYEESKRRDN